MEKEKKEGGRTVRNVREEGSHKRRTEMKVGTHMREGRREGR
jgi:hypothetical protein